MMDKMWKAKRIIIVWLMFVAFITSGTFGSFTAADAKAAASESEVRMLNNLIGYVYQSEIMYSDMRWVLESFNRFNKERTWDNLLLARASLSIAERDIAGCCLPDIEMTSEDQIYLMNHGIDVSFMENMPDLFIGEQTALLNTCSDLRYFITEGVFLNHDWDICIRYISLLEKLMDYDFLYLANTSDWVLSIINDDEVTDQFHRVMGEYCPNTYAYQAVVLETPEEIEAETDSVLDSIEDLITDKARILGAANHQKNMMNEWLKREDYSSIGKDLLDFAGIPLAVFFPDWFSDYSVFYYWEENGSIMTTPFPGTMLERAPDGCKITISGVTKEEANAYMYELEEAGLPCMGSVDDGDTLNVLFEYENSTFSLIWESGTATILITDSSICLVPRWYLPAVQANGSQ